MSKTKKVMVGISSTIVMLGLGGCASDYESQDIPPAPDDSSCSDWEWDMDDGVWECDDGGSSHYGHSYYRGRYYDSKSSLYKSKDYLDYKKSSSFAGISDGSVKKSSGFGSGLKSFGG
ncbi:aminotransferase yhxA [Schinkia sp. CFF1]